MLLHGAPQGGEAGLRRRSCGVFSPFGDTLDATLPRSIVETNTPGAPAPRIRRNFAEPQRSRKQAEIDATLHASDDRLTPEAFRTRYGEGFARTDREQRMSATLPAETWRIVAPASRAGRAPRAMEVGGFLPSATEAEDRVADARAALPGGVAAVLRTPIGPLTVTLGRNDTFEVPDGSLIVIDPEVRDRLERPLLQRSRAGVTAA